MASVCVLRVPVLLGGIVIGAQCKSFAFVDTRFYSCVVVSYLVQKKKPPFRAVSETYLWRSI